MNRCINSKILVCLSPSVSPVSLCLSPPSLSIYLPPSLFLYLPPSVPHVPMQVHRGVMPSHTMYALNMERILARLWHPSMEELEQDHVHRQRLAGKEGLLLGS